MLGPKEEFGNYPPPTKKKNFGNLKIEKTHNFCLSKIFLTNKLNLARENNLASLSPSFNLYMF
jgi:hypothetical protein